MFSRVGAFLLTLLLTIGAVAQQNCPLPPVIQPVSAAENMFSDTQEVDLGDAMAETVALHVNIIHDQELSRHLQDIGDRLVRYLPSTQLNFRFYLIDLPEVNAFSIAGGRVYVSRKLVAFTRNDNELAGVVGHELGHIVTHQTAIEMTRAFREVLGVTQVGNRDDIFNKFHEYVENSARRGKAKRDQEEKHQLVADQVAIFTIARAGFSPQALVDFWDRFGELHGKKGNWLSDLFGSTTPEQHRLRDMVKNTAALPVGCAQGPNVADVDTFNLWQQVVIDYDAGQRTESLTGLISKRQLSDRLRPDITNLRFSPDGKFILAQDDGGISVASREPFAFVFYIPAPDARDAQFSPDSQSIVFLSSGLRVEVWSVADHKRKSVHEVTVREPCVQSEVSPDGNFFACLNSQFSLLLVNVASGSALTEKKAFFSPSLWEFLDLVGTILAAHDSDDEYQPAQDFVRFASLKFSPDGRYFLAGHANQHLLYDLENSRELSIPGSIKTLTTIDFAFLGPDRVIGIDPGSPQKSHLVSFPSGENLESDIRLAPQIRLRGATHGNSLFVGPLQRDPLGVMNLDNKKINLGLKHDAADIFDGLLVTERMNGEIALRRADNADVLAFLQLPEASLGALSAVAASSDLGYVAVSTRTRGAVWDITHDKRLFHVRRFNGSGFDGSVLFADFPKFQESARAIGELNVATGATSNKLEFKNEIVTQQGTFLLEIRPRNKNGISRTNADVQVHDLRTGQVLWSRYFPAAVPAISFSSCGPVVLMRWRLSQPGAQDELQHFSGLRGKSDKNDYLFEVADANLGGAISAFVVKTNNGSFHYVQGTASRNWVVMQASGDQILTYSLPAGDERGHFFGSRPALSSSNLLAVESEKREIEIYDLTTSQRKQDFVFAQPIALKVFSADGQRLLVMTSDQTVYLLDVNGEAPQTQPETANNR